MRGLSLSARVCVCRAAFGFAGVFLGFGSGALDLWVVGSRVKGWVWGFKVSGFRV